MKHILLASHLNDRKLIYFGITCVGVFSLSDVMITYDDAKKTLTFKSANSTVNDIVEHAMDIFKYIQQEIIRDHSQLRIEIDVRDILDNKRK
jgi:NRPS condensation-like uncharacterized protein